MVSGSTLGADGAGECSGELLDTMCVVRVPIRLPNTQILIFPGTVVAAHDENNEILNMRVFFVPTRGWEKDLLAPEAP